MHKHFCYIPSDFSSLGRLYVINNFMSLEKISAFIIKKTRPKIDLLTIKHQTLIFIIVV